MFSGAFASFFEERFNLSLALPRLLRDGVPCALVDVEASVAACGRAPSVLGNRICTRLLERHRITCNSYHFGCMSRNTLTIGRQLQ